MDLTQILTLCWITTVHYYGQDAVDMLCCDVSRLQCVRTRWHGWQR